MFNFWNFDEAPEFTGVYTGQYRQVGKFKKNVFCFSTGGKIIHVWAYAQLSLLMYGVPFKTEVRIKFIGIEKHPESDKPFKNFEVEIINPPKENEQS